MTSKTHMNSLCTLPHAPMAQISVMCNLSGMADTKSPVNLRSTLQTLSTLRPLCRRTGDANKISLRCPCGKLLKWGAHPESTCIRYCHQQLHWWRVADLMKIQQPRPLHCSVPLLSPDSVCAHVSKHLCRMCVLRPFCSCTRPSCATTVPARAPASPTSSAKKKKNRAHLFLKLCLELFLRILESLELPRQMTQVRAATCIGTAALACLGHHGFGAAVV